MRARKRATRRGGTHVRCPLPRFLPSTSPSRAPSAPSKFPLPPSLPSLSLLPLPPQVLCKGFPQEFVAYFQYVRALRFDEKPDYSYLRRLFRDLFAREGEGGMLLAREGGGRPAVCAGRWRWACCLRGEVKVVVGFRRVSLPVPPYLSPPCVLTQVGTGTLFLTGRSSSTSGRRR